MAKVALTPETCLEVIRAHFDVVGAPAHDPLELEQFVIQRVQARKRNKLLKGDLIRVETLKDWGNKFIEERTEYR